MADVAQQKQDQTVRSIYETYVKYHQHNSAKTTAVGEKIGVHTAQNPFPMYRHVEKTGVIYATTRAREHGFKAEDPTWANMGQGAPETGDIEGAPGRSFDLHIPHDEVEYGPNTGIPELRKKVADYYNHLYRKGKKSQYTADNVCIVPGGRAGLTRVMAILDHVQVGFFSPDYTAYEQALGLFTRITPSVYLHRDVNATTMDPKEFEFQTVGRGISAVLLSNPANPTGQSIEGRALAQYVRIARDHNVSIIMDEFYSHYYYDGKTTNPLDGGADNDSNWPKTVSSAKYIVDVNKDPILIINGLTKNWRCPGFRCCWVVGPAAIVEKLGNAGSFLDGGCNAPLQKLALPLMELDFIRRDTWALQRHFKAKRDFLLTELAGMGIKVKWQPTATFYVWADLSDLPPPLNDCLVFLEECVKHKIIIVPGVFFDCNPRSVRHLTNSSAMNNVRFSYGPTFENLKIGMENMKVMISKFKFQDSAMRPSTYFSSEIMNQIREGKGKQELRKVETVTKPAFRRSPPPVRLTPS